MAHRADFSMKIVESGQMSMCDVCAEYIGQSERRIRTYIGESAQSDVCLPCANLIAKRLSPAKEGAPRRRRVQPVEVAV